MSFLTHQTEAKISNRVKEQQQLQTTKTAARKISHKHVNRQPAHCNCSIHQNHITFGMYVCVCVCQPRVVYRICVLERTKTQNEHEEEHTQKAQMKTNCKDDINHTAIQSHLHIARARTLSLCAGMLFVHSYAYLCVKL